jgi:hypothetical protein
MWTLRPTDYPLPSEYRVSTQQLHTSHFTSNRACTTVALWPRGSHLLSAGLYMYTCFNSIFMRTRNSPIQPRSRITVWHYTLKRFADPALALAQAHEARTLQLRASSSSGGKNPPPSPSSKQGLHPCTPSPLYTLTLGEERRARILGTSYTTTSPNSTSSDTPSTGRKRNSNSNQSCRPFEENTKNGYPNPSQNQNIKQ